VKYGRLDSNPFHSPTTQDGKVHTSKFMSKKLWLGITYMQASYYLRRWSTLVLRPLLEDEQRAKCEGVVDGS
jgi:hypothetical protein